MTTKVWLQGATSSVSQSIVYEFIPDLSGWTALAGYVSSKKARLPTNNELRSLLAGQPYPAVAGEDIWVPTVDTVGNRDWMQIGDNRFGLSHRELTGYPSWGDAPVPGKGYEPHHVVLVVTPIVSYEFVPKLSGWADLAALAISKKARLPTNTELRDVLAFEPYPAVAGEDTWVPTVDTVGNRDWMQIGDNRTGLSHRELTGYPSWGDAPVPGQGYEPHHAILMATPVLIYEYVHQLSSWAELSAVVSSKNARLPTNNEVRAWLAGQPHPAVAGEDIWVPTVDTVGNRDWMQIGDNRFGLSHRELTGYPSWGDAPVLGKGYEPHHILLAATPNITHEEVPTLSGWATLAALVFSRKARLPKNSEVRSLLSGQPYAAVAGKDVWVPTVDTTGNRDWVQIGDSRHGLNHRELTGYPSWGDAPVAGQGYEPHHILVVG